MKTYGIKRILMAGAVVSALLMGGSSAQAMPSPLVEYTSVRDAWAVAGLPVYTPTLLPVGYVQKEIIVIDKSLAEIFYRNDAGKEILFRMAKGDADISGDNNIYEVNQVMQVGRQYIRVKGTENSSASRSGHAVATPSPSPSKSLFPSKPCRQSSARSRGTNGAS